MKAPKRAFRRTREQALRGNLFGGREVRAIPCRGLFNPLKAFKERILKVDHTYLVWSSKEKV